MIVTPEMLAAGWRELKRAGMPPLGPGPGLAEAYEAMRALDASGEAELAELRAENARLRASLAARQQDIAALQAGAQASFDAHWHGYSMPSWREFFGDLNDRTATETYLHKAQKSPQPVHKLHGFAPIDDHDVA